MKKVILFLASICCFLLGGTPVLAAENDDAKNYISEFVQEISKDEDYAIWTESTPIFGYELYGADLENIVGDLYYMMMLGSNKAHLAP